MNRERPRAARLAMPTLLRLVEPGGPAEGRGAVVRACWRLPD